MLSVIILAKNVENEIVPALKTAKFADEIVVVDTGSTDGTIKLAKQYADKVVNTSGHDFAKWRNLGAREASGDWLLYLDSDERIPYKLGQEIGEVLEAPKHQAYTIERYEILLGKHLPHWGDRRVLRLIEKKALLKWVGKLHEQPKIKGSVGSLKHKLVHLTHKNIDEKLTGTIAWSRLEAQMLLAANHPPMKGWRFARILATEFWNRAIRQQLWRDGTEGWIEIFYQMFSRFLSYVRLWEAQRKPSLSETYRIVDRKLLEEWKAK
jgi:glycosyltransferase involved in cell wall biosynthesis